MGVLGDNGWCFCSGGGKSERMKGSIFSGKSPAMASISPASTSGGDGVGGGGGGGGTGCLVHRSLLLTTHANVPSVAAAEAAEIRIHHGRLLARLVPHRFFITSSVLDLTIVGLDTLDSDSTSQGNQPHYLKTCWNSSLDLGSIVYLLGHTDKNELMVGEGKVVITTDNLIKFSTDGVTWCPGSAGFDAQGNLAFMVCDPMKLATPITKSSSASTSSSLSGKKDSHMQFGIPIPIIRDWLHQHWEGSLDELSKPKQPIIRLMSTGQKSEHSCASFTHRQVFKPTEGDGDEVSSSSQLAAKSRFQFGSSDSANVSHKQGIPIPEIYESPKLTSGPVRRREIAPIHHLDINFPPRVPTSIVVPLPLKQLLMNSDENNAKECRPRIPSRENANPEAAREADPVGSYQGDCYSEGQSSSPMGVSERRNEIDGFSSGEETMYSAETMESRNFPSPRENKSQQVGRSQSCMNYNRWTYDQRNSAARKGAAFQKRQTKVPVRQTRSQAAPLPQRSHDYYSPTVSSSMKKRNSTEQPRNSTEKPVRPRQSVVLVTPRRAL